MHTVKIYVDHTYYYNGVQAHGAVFHLSADWLTQNGNIAEKQETLSYTAMMSM